jgi:hypothetical protein
MFRFVALGLVLFNGGARAAEGGAGYAQASGYFKQELRPTLYQPLNLLDGRDNTAWCSPTADALNELLTFGFKGTVQIDELKVTTGNNFDANNFGEFSRARKLLLKSGREKRTLELQDVRGPQVLSVSPPLTGSRFVIEVLDSYPSDDLDAPTCLTDVIFVASGKPLSGPWLTTKLKFDKPTQLVMGTWYQGYDKTPDHTLTFHFDGTFRFTVEPFDTTRSKAQEVSGTFDASTSKLSMVFSGKRYALKYARDAAKKGGLTLTFEGEMPAELKGIWRNSP